MLTTPLFIYYLYIRTLSASLWNIGTYHEVRKATIWAHQHPPTAPLGFHSVMIDTQTARRLTGVNLLAPTQSPWMRTAGWKRCGLRGGQACWSRTFLCKSYTSSNIWTENLFFFFLNRQQNRKVFHSYATACLCRSLSEPRGPTGKIYDLLRHRMHLQPRQERQMWWLHPLLMWERWPLSGISQWLRNAPHWPSLTEHTVLVCPQTLHFLQTSAVRIVHQCLCSKCFWV